MMSDSISREVFINEAIECTRGVPGDVAHLSKKCLNCLFPQRHESSCLIQRTVMFRERTAGAGRRAASSQIDRVLPFEITDGGVWRLAQTQALCSQLLCVCVLCVAKDNYFKLRDITEDQCLL